MNGIKRLTALFIASISLTACGGPPDVPGSVTVPSPLGEGQPCKFQLLTCGVNGDIIVPTTPFAIPVPYPRVYCGCPVGSFLIAGGEPVARWYRLTAAGTADTYWVKTYVTPETLSTNGLDSTSARIAFGLLMARKPDGTPPNWTAIRAAGSLQLLMERVEPQASPAQISAAIRAAGL